STLRWFAPQGHFRWSYLYLHSDIGRPTTISYIAWLYVILLIYTSCYAFLAHPDTSTPPYCLPGSTVPLLPFYCGYLSQEKYE
ncbi:MAG: hypothetical protein U9R27_02520, partial [Campylobacterota bacterium]|nr:hypothetical protein [Campylobacterota bacterium]